MSAAEKTNPKQFQQLTLFESVGDLIANADISGDYNALAQQALSHGDPDYSREKFWGEKLEAARQPNITGRPLERVSGEVTPIFKKVPNVAERIAAHGGVDHPITLSHNEAGDKTIVDGHHRLAVMAERDRQSGQDTYVPVQWDQPPHKVTDMDYKQWSYHGFPTREESDMGLSAELGPDYESVSKNQTYNPELARARRK